MLHMTTRTYSVADSKCLINKKNDRSALLRGRFHGTLREEREWLLNREQLSEEQEHRLMLIENTLRG